MPLILDIEADNLLLEATRCHIIGFKDTVTGEVRRWLEGDLGWMAALDKADIVVGHNVIGYDLELLRKLFNYKLPTKVKVHDTLILSQVLNYRRFPNLRHRLSEWGEHLGCPKLDFDDFSQLTPEMITYWERDLELTEKVYNTLMVEFWKLFEREPKIARYLNAEGAVAAWCARAELHGWPFDLEAAKKLLAEMEAEMDSTRALLQPLLGSKVVPKDKEAGEALWKEPKWIKSGAYNHHTAGWFEIDPCTGQDEDRLVEGPYTRIEFKELDLDSITDVKIFLFRNGWVPTEYNYSFDEETRKKVQTSPKITEDSLECMHGDGAVYCKFLTTSSRYNILKNWIANCDEEGNLHGACFPIGTPSMRARHSIIVNVPSTDSAWGPEMRKLFINKPGWKIIGCDSSGNQARGLAHYLESEEYTDTLLNGDIHAYNAAAATKVLLAMKEPIKIKIKDGSYVNEVPRANAKRILYAFLFGASGGKLWSYIFGTMDDKKGKKFKSGFTAAVPGFKALIDKLEAVYARTRSYGDGYIIGIAGNRIYCDSFHKLLVYLLQACEKATCSMAVMLTMQRLEAEGIPYIPLIMMHDEEDFMVPEEHAERAAEIGKQAFKDGPKLLGIDIMDGSAKIGNNWYEIH